MASATPRPAPAAEAEGAVSPAILIVDDERNIRRTLGLVLRGEGYSVVEAESAEQALEKLTSGERVDLAIVDLLLPKMSGLQLVERVQKDEALGPLPMICISGHATVHDAVTAIKLGARDFFEKPLSPVMSTLAFVGATRSISLNKRCIGALCPIIS